MHFHDLNFSYSQTKMGVSCCVVELHLETISIIHKESLINKLDDDYVEGIFNLKCNYIK